MKDVRSKGKGKYVRDKGVEITRLSNMKGVGVRKQYGVRPCVVGLRKVC